MQNRWAIMGGALILGASFVVAPLGAQAGPVEDAIAAARQDVEAGRCEDAYGRLASFDGLASRAHLLAGQCRIRAGLYPEALQSLDQARGDRALTSSQVGDLELFRGVALYHLERYAEASDALDSAYGLSDEDAQLALYRGLLALREGDNDRAAPALESAARIQPQLTEPVASYYAGLAWQGASERTKAREAFRRVIAVDPDGPWGTEARKLLDSTELFPWYVTGRVGFEYDSNVVLRGGATQLVRDALGRTSINEDLEGDEDDFRGTWRLDAGLQLFAKGDWTGGVVAGYSGDAHDELSDLNTHYPSIGAYLARRLGPQTTTQARYQFGHAWVNDDPFLQSHVGELALVHHWDRAGTTVLAGNVLWNDVRFDADDIDAGSGAPDTTCPGTATPGLPCGPPGLNESRERDRDGLGLGATIEHRLPLAVPKALGEVFEKIELAGAYRFLWFDAQGDEWKHFANTFSAGLLFEFPLDFRVGTTVSYQLRLFDNPSTFPDEEVLNFEYALDSNDREEHQVNFEFELEKGITPNFSVSARYAYQETESNRRVYDITRHITGAYLNFRFD